MGTLYRFRFFCQGVCHAIALGAFCRFFRPRFALCYYCERTYANFSQKEMANIRFMLHSLILWFYNQAPSFNRWCSLHSFFIRFHFFFRQLDTGTIFFAQEIYIRSNAMVRRKIQTYHRNDQAGLPSNALIIPDKNIGNQLRLRLC